MCFTSGWSRRQGCGWEGGKQAAVWRWPLLGGEGGGPGGEGRRSSQLTPCSVSRQQPVAAAAVVGSSSAAAGPVEEKNACGGAQGARKTQIKATIESTSRWHRLVPSMSSRIDPEPRRTSMLLIPMLPRLG